MPVNGREVTLEVDGVQLRGAITLLETHDLEVELLEPVRGPRVHSPHVFYLARPCVKYAVNGELTPLGIDCVERLLRCLYRACRVVDDHLDWIDRLVAEARQEVHVARERGVVLTKERAQAERRRLRRQLRHEGLDIRSYERQLRSIRERERAGQCPELHVRERLRRAWEARFGEHPFSDAVVSVLDCRGRTLWVEESGPV